MGSFGRYGAAGPIDNPGQELPALGLHIIKRQAQHPFRIDPIRDGQGEQHRRVKHEPFGTQVIDRAKGHQIPIKGGRLALVGFNTEHHGAGAAIIGHRNRTGRHGNAGPVGGGYGRLLSAGHTSRIGGYNAAAVISVTGRGNHRRGRGDIQDTLGHAHEIVAVKVTGSSDGHHTDTTYDQAHNKATTQARAGLTLFSGRRLPGLRRPGRHALRLNIGAAIVAKLTTGIVGLAATAAIDDSHVDRYSSCDRFYRIDAAVSGRPIVRKLPGHMLPP